MRILLTAACFLLTGLFETTTANEPALDDPFIHFGQKEILLSPEAGMTISLVIKSNSTWSLSVPADVDWFRLDKTTGAGNDTIRVTVINMLVTGKPREANITASIITSSTVHALVRVIQRPYAHKIIWKRSFNTPADEMPAGIASTQDGGSVVAGSSYTISKTSKDADHKNIFVTCFDEKGALRWTRLFGGNKDDEACSVVATCDGGFVVAGITESHQNGDVGYNHGKQDLWLIKLNDKGDTIWTRVLGGSGRETWCNIAVTSDKGIVAAVQSDSNDGDVGDPGNGRGDFNTWVIKLDDKGSITWSKVYGGPGRETARAVAAFPGGGVIIAGSTFSKNSGDIRETRGGEDGWMLRLHDNGDTVWTRSLGGPGDDIVLAVSVAGDSSIFLAGSTYSMDAHTLNDNSDFLVGKLNSTGETIWMTIQGFRQFDIAKFISATPDGGCIVAGISQLNNDKSGQASERYGCFVFKSNRDAQMVWDKMFSNESIEFVYGFLPGASESYLLAVVTQGKSKDKVNWDWKLVKINAY